MYDLFFFALSVFGISFFIKESYLTDKVRIWLISKSVFFYELFSCYQCVGTHAGYIYYLLKTPMHSWNIFELIIYAFAGGSVSLIISGLLSKINSK